jgi:DNA invertase Pin-like site-specific DNA recombinase
MTIRAAIYARSSPDCLLSIEDQVERLSSIACEHGWKVEGVFADRPLAARTGLDRRPGEMALIEVIRNGVIDKVLLWSVCRIGKSLMELVSFMKTCRTSSVSIYLEQQNVDTETSNGLSLFDLAGMMALHVRQTRRGKILRGQAAARALSIRFGRPPISQARQEKARRELTAGKGVREAARIAGISAASVSRLKNAMSVAAPTA